MIAADHLEQSSRGGAYEEVSARTAEGIRRPYSSSMLSNPKVIVSAVSRAVRSRRSRTRYLVGFGAKPLVAAHVLLPTRVFDRIIMRVM